MKKTICILLAFLCLFSLASFAQSEIAVLLNGQPLYFDVQPVMESNRVLVPLRAIFEALDSDISWDNETQTVIASGNKVIVLQIDSDIAFVNGEKKQLDVPARLVNGRSMVPLRFVGEAVGADVHWDSETLTVSITK